MRVLLDINVLLDVVLARTPWDLPAAKLLAAIERGLVEGFVAGHTLPTLHYVVAKSRDRETATAAVADLLGLVEIVPIGKEDIHRALLLPCDDFEDAVQIAAALKIGTDHIITRNEPDFQAGPITPIRPETILSRL